MNESLDCIIFQLIKVHLLQEYSQKIIPATFTQTQHSQKQIPAIYLIFLIPLNNFRNKQMSLSKQLPWYLQSMYHKCNSKKQKETLWPLFMDGVQLPQG